MSSTTGAILPLTSSANTSAATTRYKHSSDSSREITKIKIIKGSKTIIFDTTLSTRVVSLNTPRISKLDGEKLSEHYIFRMQSIEDISEEDGAVIRRHQDNQRSNFSITNQHSNTLSILKRALSSCKSHTELYDLKNDFLGDHRSVPRVAWDRVLSGP